jgi:rhamnogalacturonyl hydrolase YesR
VDIHTPSDNRLASIKDAVDVQLYQPGVGAWSWIDAIFMEAPVLSRLCDLYQDTAYCAKLYALYRDAKISRGLYNATTKLWYENASFARQNILWSRGNGWVIAPHVRLLEYLPLNDSHRSEYVATLRAMAGALKARQRADGFWNVSLPDPGTPEEDEPFPGPETSGTALITYAMA